MWLLATIVAGLISGFIASKIVNRGGKRLALDIALGGIGAVAGGLLLMFFEGPHGLLPVAIAGALLVVAYHVLRRAALSNR